MRNIAITDYLLLFPYLVFFYLWARKMFRNSQEPALRKYFFTAFWLRMVGSILFSMMVQYYYGYGDPFTFFSGSNFFTDKIASDISNIRYLFAPFSEMIEWYNSSYDSEFTFSGYFGNPSGNMIMRISAILSYLSFNRFLIISLFFGFFSFAGQWKLFLVFNEINEKQRTNLLAFAILYSPSIWFWGSGLLKDSICIGGLGFMVYILYNAITNKKISFLNVILFLFIFYVVAVIKSYITNILLISVAISVVFLFLQGIKNIVAKIGLLLLFLIVSGVVLFQIDFASQMNDVVEDAVLQINAFQQNYQNVSAELEDSKGGFSMKEIDPTLSSIILRSPGVILSCLYRPFIWESRKLIMVFTALETLILLYYTLYLLFKLKIFGFFKLIFTDKYLFFCFTLSMLFALIIGFTTFNFGTMIRYKIIFLPFFYFLLVRIYILFVNSSQKKPAVRAS